MKIAAISIADYCEATAGMPHDAERLYFRMILKMLSREGGLPDDDAENARIFGYDPRIYRRLKVKLLQWPKAIYLQDGLLKNERVENDIQAAKDRRNEKAENGRKGGLAKAKVGRKSETSSAEVREKSSHISHTTNSEINEIGVASPSPSPTPKETPFSPSNVVAVGSWANGFAEKDDRCAWIDGRIVLGGKLKTEWLAEFGGDEAGLSLALKQAAGYVQPNNRCKPLEAQVSAQLARLVADRRDKDRRYAAAVAQKATTKPSTSSAGFDYSMGFSPAELEAMRNARPAN